MTEITQRLLAALADRYRLERELGQGGMATVYLAHDIKHDRKVAVKVLRPELAAVLGAERFLNEIRVTANLQHPHILALYDSGASDSFLYYVMPYVDGETLADRLKREKQLGIEDAVQIAMEIAGALDYAHRQGVIHRDIKPANILLQDGGVLVADFGIALALKAAGGDRLTETGLSLGTPHYMSPEQATGDRDVDARTDVYALGAVTYEMLAGDPPHTGSSIQAVLSRVLTEEPRPLGDLRHSVPAHVGMAVEKALAKIPADRFTTPADFGQALKDPRFTLAYSRAATRARPSVVARPPWRDWRAVAAAVLLFVVGGFGGYMVRGAAPADRTLARFRVPVAAARGLTGAPVNTLALSPDGRTIVYVGRSGGGSAIQMYARRLENLDARPIAGGEGASFPAFSPDGNRLAFFAPGGLFTLPVGGGTPTQVANIATQTLTQAAWLDDRTLVATSVDGALIRVGLNGDIAPIARPDSMRGEAFFAVHSVLPDRRTILVIASLGSSVNGPVYAVDAESGDRHLVMESPTNAVWYSDGHLLWALPTGGLRGAAFDVDRLAIVGSNVTIADGVRQAVGGPAQVAVSPNGSLVYLPEQPFNLMFVARDGRREIVAEGRRFHNPRFSPDGRLLAVDFLQQGSRDVWVLDLRQGTLSRVSFENDGHDAIWFPDGRSLAYISGTGILRRSVDGTGGVDTVIMGSLLTGPQDFTADATALVTAPTGPNGSFDVGLLRLDGDGPRQQSLVATPFNEQYAILSPDGRWLAYTTDETGRDEVYVIPFPDGGRKTLVSRDGGAEPMWSPDGRELFYVGPRDGLPHLMTARVSTTGEFAVMSRTPMFDLSEFEPAAPHANYHISPDGTRFAFVHQGTLSEMIFVLNWTEEVRRMSRSGGR